MLNEILRICAITALLIIALQFLKVVSGNKNAWFVVAFTLSVVSYLIIEGRTELSSLPLRLLLVGPFLLPLFFWLLSKSVFDDHFRMSTKFFTLTLVVLLVHYVSLFIGYNVSLSGNSKTLALLIPKVLSFVFMALGVWEALRDRKFDLIDARLRFRNVFIIITASVIGATLIVETIEIGSAIPEILPVIQKAVITILSLTFIHYNLELNLSFFIRPEKEEKRIPENNSNSQIVLKIQKLLTEEKIYRTEGLTIGRLAETMKEQEYRVRRTINGQLGFRNFNDFLNQYRVQEACAILQDPQKSNLTILEIAYSLGYQSIGPFNKAFKDETGLTPTVFRKQNLQ